MCQVNKVYLFVHDFVLI